MSRVEVRQHPVRELWNTLTLLRATGVLLGYTEMTAPVDIGCNELTSEERTAVEDGRLDIDLGGLRRGHGAWRPDRESGKTVGRCATRLCVHRRRLAGCRAPHRCRSDCSPGRPQKRAAVDKRAGA